MRSHSRRVRSAVLAAALVVGSLFPESAAAQLSVRPGFRAGITSTTYVGDAGEEILGRQTGVTVGVFTSVDVGGRFAVQPELNYVQKGAVLEAFGGTPRRTEKSGFIEGAVLGKAQLPRWHSVGASLLVGPTLGTQLTHDDRTWYDGTRPNVGLVVGGDVRLRVGSGKIASIVLDARYQFGFTDFKHGGVSSPDRADGTHEVDVPQIRHRGLAFSLGITL